MTVETEIGSITGTPEVLNEISIAFGDSEDINRLRRNNALADKARKVSFTIYYELREIGFYDK